MHQEIVLKDVGSRQRIKQLQLRCDVAARLAPGLVTGFTQRNVREATPALPFSRFSVAVDARYTYVPSTLIAKIPGMALEQVYHATLGYFFEDEADDMKRCFGIWRSTTAVHSLGGIRHYARVEYFSASGFSATCNSVVSAELSDSIFTICVDFVDSDKRFPKYSQYRTRREPCIMVTATPARDPVTGLDYMLLHQVVVIRYNLLPISQLLHEEIRITQSLSSGDLLIARICRYFRDQQQRSTSSQGQHHRHNALETQTYAR